MNKYHTLNTKLEISFLGWFSNAEEANKAAPITALVIEDSDLYRFIEQSKEALNHP